MPYKDPADWTKWNLRRHRTNRAALDELKSKPCTDCKKTFPTYVMDFDHVPERGAKIANVCELIGNRKITSKVAQTELAKCDLVCANCHKIRTHKRRVVKS